MRSVLVSWPSVVIAVAVAACGRVDPPSTSLPDAETVVSDSGARDTFEPDTVDASPSDTCGTLAEPESDAATDVLASCSDAGRDAAVDGGGWCYATYGGGHGGPPFPHANGNCPAGWVCLGTIGPYGPSGLCAPPSPTCTGVPCGKIFCGAGAVCRTVDVIGGCPVKACYQGPIA